jgi:hypothetical protein
MIHGRTGMRRLINSGFACVLTTVAMMGAAQAEDLGSCRFRMPRETQTIVYGSYGGGLTSQLDLEGETHKVRRIEIRVPKKDAPLFLVMTAYDPVEWDLKIDAGAEIAAVLVMGYHNQAIRHLPEGVPHAFSTYKSGPGAECPKAIYAYNRGADFDALRKMLNLEFSRSVDEFHTGSSAQCLYKGCVVSKPPAASFWQTLFGSAQSAADRRPQPPVRATTRVVDRSDSQR